MLAVVLQVVVSGTTCPDGRAMEEALERRGLETSADEAPVRLEVEAASGGVEATLVDRTGELLLDRTVPAGRCEDVADAIALLVQRRLEGVAWEAPPVEAEGTSPAAVPEPATPAHAKRPARPPAERPRARPSLDALAGILFATGFSNDAGSAGPEIGATLRLARPLVVGMSVARLRHELDVSSGALAIDRFPLSLHGGWSRRRAALELDVEVRVEIETLSARTRGIARPGSATLAAVRAGPTVAIGTELDAPIWIGFHAGALLPFVGNELLVDAPGGKISITRQLPAVELGVAVVWRLGM